MVNGFFVDGFLAEEYDDNQLSYKIAFEYMGCHVHQCPHNCRKSIQKESEIAAEQQRLSVVQNGVDELICMYSCQWNQIKRNVQYDAKLSCFLGKRDITNEKIIEAVRYGFKNCSCIG